MPYIKIWIIRFLGKLGHWVGDHIQMKNEVSKSTWSVKASGK